jgi:hypothetical protein
MAGLVLKEGFGGGYTWNCQGADTMSERKTATNEELSRYLDELPDLLNGEAGGPDGRFPDGTVYDYDETLQATVETAPDGNRYVVSYQKGRGLVRVRELGVGISQPLISERRAG